MAATSSGNLRLQDGARIAIIGGGPAGAFFAHFALRLARQAGLRVGITIFDGKNFTLCGPAGCNKGAGVVSEMVAARLAAEGIDLPEDRVQRHIDGYYLQTRHHGFLLTHPDGEHRISSFFRGGGPRLSPPADNVSFDDFLVAHVQREGAGLIELVDEPVIDLQLPGRPQDPVLLLYGRAQPLQRYEADLVVGAFGLNSSMGSKLATLGFGYRLPPSVRACQTELALPPEHIQRTLGDHIHTFLLRGMDAWRFGVLTPKEAHITVTVVGRRDLHADDLAAFLRQPQVRARLPADWQYSPDCCVCFPRLAVGHAQHPYANRLVIVGDASYCRYYKNGFESALTTAQLAAEAAFQHGVAADALARWYDRPARATIVGDNLYGRVLYALNDFVCRHDLLAETFRDMCTGAAEDQTVARLRTILWGMFTGDIPYRRIFFAALQPALFLRLALTAARVARRRRKTGTRTGGQDA